MLKRDEIKHEYQLGPTGNQIMYTAFDFVLYIPIERERERERERKKERTREGRRMPQTCQDKSEIQPGIHITLNRRYVKIYLGEMGREADVVVMRLSLELSPELSLDFHGLIALQVIHLGFVFTDSWEVSKKRSRPARGPHPKMVEHDWFRISFIEVPERRPKREMWLQGPSP